MAWKKQQDWEKIFLFYLHRKDPSGIENWYLWYFAYTYTYLFICHNDGSEILEKKKKNPKLVPGVGLMLQGACFVQMGIPFLEFNPV